MTNNADIFKLLKFMLSDFVFIEGTRADIIERKNRRVKNNRKQ